MFKLFQDSDNQEEIDTNGIELRDTIREQPTPNKVIDFANNHNLKEYIDISHTLGFCPSELTIKKLKQFFQEENILLYEYDEVFEWMTYKKDESGAEKWIWRPLRNKDVLSKVEWNVAGAYYIVQDGGYKEESCSPYDKLVPKEVLQKVKIIENHFQDEVAFFVTDYIAQHPDPFIMVRPKQDNNIPLEESLLIFDMWDEPGFSK